MGMCYLNFGKGLKERNPGYAWADRRRKAEHEKLHSSASGAPAPGAERVETRMSLD